MKYLPPILVVDGCEHDLNLLKLVIKGAFGEVAIDTANDGASLTRALAGRPYGLVMTEFAPGWIAGEQLMDLLRERLPEAAVIVLSGADDSTVASDALRGGADGFIVKDARGLTTIEEVIRTALFWSRRRRSKEDSASLRIIDGLPVGVFVADAKGVILDANPSLAMMLGHQRPAELAHRPIHHFFADPATARGFEAALAGSSLVLELEAELRRFDDSTIWSRLRIRPAPPTKEAPPRLHGLVEDIGDYRRALEELDVRSEELVQSAKDLEELGFVVSHDLQQPLAGLARALEKIDTPADASTKNPVIQARKSAAALERMLGSVLRLTRLDRQDLKLGAVDLHRVVERVLDLLQNEIEAVKAKVVIDPLPTVTADEGQMEQLFHNLISNAIKFHGTSPPRIQIGAEDDGDEWRLKVSDKGIGIDPSAAERVFKIFQRLHTQDEIPGNGIGLSVCRRIAGRHGGRIWVDSRPGEGSTFVFTIPHEEYGNP